MVSVLSSSVVDNGFESGRVKIIFCWFSAQYTVLGSKSKEWLPRNQDSVSQWSDMYVHMWTVVSVN
jgi:hypothetical protein